MEQSYQKQTETKIPEVIRHPEISEYVSALPRFYIEQHSYPNIGIRHYIFTRPEYIGSGSDEFMTSLFIVTPKKQGGRK